MAFKLLDRARMAVSGTPGTGNITLGAAVNGYQSFTQAGINNGDSFPYAIADGNNWEYGVATYASSGNQLSRTVTKSSLQSSSPVSLTSHAIISSVVRAEDIAQATVLSGLTDVQVAPDATQDGWALVWKNSDAKYELAAITYANLPDKPTIPTNSGFYLYQLGDTNMSPGPFNDGYLVKWDNSSNKFILAPPSFGQQSVVSGFFAGLLSGDEVLMQYIAYKNILLPASGVLSRAYASVPPTADCSCTITINGSGIGTIDFTAGNHYGVYSVTYDHNLFAGGTLQVIAPTVPDATLADVSVSIVFNAP